MADNPNTRLAVLIDADNAQSAHIHELLAEIARHGTATVRRAYGDWTGTQLTKWKDVLHTAAIQPIQQFAYTKGKNATDSALIIDAMDLLHAGKIDGFCLVSSDSDFTRLATRIREDGLPVYGFGQQKTPEPFVKACTRFTYVEVLAPVEEVPVGEKTGATGNAVQDAAAAPAEKRVTVKDWKELEAIFRTAIEAAAGEDGWAGLAQVKNLIDNSNPSFDYRNYNRPERVFKNLSDLCGDQIYLQLEKRKNPSGNTHPYIRFIEKADRVKKT